MMNTQESWFLYQGASHLGAQGGTLRVEAGQVWLTRSGDPADHILRAGEAIRVPPGDLLVESWNASTPARIVWEPRSRFAEWRDRFGRTCAQCWDLVDPARRVALGSAAAIAALLTFGLVFGPLSSARAVALAEAHASGTVLHNAGQETPPDERNTVERRRIAAQEARRGQAGAA
jgi:hypothetical protein